jgi:hypothetical protein
LLLSGEKHKKVKETLSYYKLSLHKNDILGARSFQGRLADEVLDLQEFLEDGFFDMFSLTYKYITEFYSDRSEIPPRACIKVFADEEIVTLFRQPNLNGRKEAGYSAYKNTAFQSIEAGKRFYLCNNIPEAVKGHKYENSRIIQEKALNYNPDFLTKDFDDMAWRQCWRSVKYVDEVNNDLDVSLKPENCYKSTLVIPMSLNSSDLDDKFIQHFELSNKAERLIFGFLCFDHRVTNFFEPNMDENFGYILADTLSLYLILQLTFTRYSSTYFQAINILVGD